MFFKFHFLNLQGYNFIAWKSFLTDIPTEFLQKISSDIAYGYRIVPFDYQNGTIHAVTDADNLLRYCFRIRDLIRSKTSFG